MPQVHSQFSRWPRACKCITVVALIAAPVVLWFAPDNELLIALTAAIYIGLGQFLKSRIIDGVILGALAGTIVGIMQPAVGNGLEILSRGDRLIMAMTCCVSLGLFAGIFATLRRTPQS